MGPIAGANVIAIPIIPIALPRFSGGYKLKITVCTSGIITPAPVACSNLPTNKIEKLGAMALTIVPIEKVQQNL